MFRFGRKIAECSGSFGRVGALLGKLRIRMHDNSVVALQQAAEKRCRPWFDKLAMRSKPLKIALPHPEPVEG